MSTTRYRCGLALGPGESALCIAELDQASEVWHVRDLRRWPAATWSSVITDIAEVLGQAVRFGDVRHLVVDVGQHERTALRPLLEAHRAGFLPMIARTKLAGSTHVELLAHVEELRTSGQLQLPQGSDAATLDDEVAAIAVGLAVGRGGHGHAFAEAWRHSSIAGLQPVPTRTNFAEERFLKETAK